VGVNDATSLSDDGNGSYCAVLSTGGIDCWGLNGSGQLGDGSVDGPDGEDGDPTPQAVAGLDDAVSVSSANPSSYCSVLSSGGIDCWGDNSWGELGVGSIGGPDGESGYDTPQVVTGVNNATSVASAGQGNYCAVLTTGGIECWGQNTESELGNGTESGPDLCPGADGDYYGCYDTSQSVTGIDDATAISCDGAYSYCAVLSTGGVNCWGNNDIGELGDGTVNYATTPQVVSGINDVASVVGDGRDAYCANLTSGGIDCWGGNTFGELGLGVIGGSDGLNGFDTPQVVPGITGVASGNGVYGTCAVLSTSGVDCWGWNLEGELGNGSIDGSDGADGYDTPQAVLSTS
jgi:alpha-tubulin suppressor-like RCC1 family protein